MNIADVKFQEAIKMILEEGVMEKGNVRAHWEDGEPAPTKFCTQYIETYDISKGEFPITTVKPTFIKNFINEIFWIYQDQTSDLNVLRNKYNINYWNDWESEDYPGTIGHRYGYVVKKYDQINKLIEGLKNDPLNRRHRIDLNQIECLDSSDGLYSCAYSTLWTVRGEYLDCTLLQRSNDVIGAYNANNIQYVALQMMIAHTVGLKPGKFTRFVQNIHIYNRHLEVAKEFLNRKPSEKQPKLIFEPKSNDFYSYSFEDFKIIDYEPQPRIKFELAI